MCQYKKENYLYIHFLIYWVYIFVLSQEDSSVRLPDLNMIF